MERPQKPLIIDIRSKEGFSPGNGRMDGGVSQRYHRRQFSSAETQNLKPITGSDFRGAASNSAGKSSQAVCLQTTSCKPSPDPSKSSRKWHQTDRSSRTSCDARGPIPEPMHQRIIEQARVALLRCCSLPALRSPLAVAELVRKCPRAGGTRGA